MQLSPHVQISGGYEGESLVGAAAFLFVMSFLGGEGEVHLCIPTADLRAVPSPAVFATDATPSRGGVTTANAPFILARTLNRVAENRGSAVRLDGGLQHEAEAWLL